MIKSWFSCQVILGKLNVNVFPSTDNKMISLYSCKFPHLKHRYIVKLTDTIAIAIVPCICKVRLSIVSTTYQYGPGVSEMPVS